MLLVAILLFISAKTVNCAGDNENNNDLYTIIAPKQIRPNATYQVSLTYVTQNVTSSPLVRLRIDDATQNQIISRDVRLRSNTTSSVALPTDNIEYYKYYRFIAEGIQDISFKHNFSLRTEIKNISILIQTDKAIYKPADTVRFRVLVLNNQLTPAALRDNDLNVFIKDANDNRVKQWRGARTRKGVFSSQLKLIEHPALGEWSIHVELNGDSEEKSKNFEIAEYVLPKFETTIDSPSDFTIRDEKIRLIVRSKYTHGKFVKGKAIVSMRPVNGDGNVVIKTVPMDGKGVVAFDTETELKLKTNIYYHSLEYTVRAIVLEEFTSRNHSATKNIQLHRERYKVDVQGGEDGQFDAGIPIHFTIRVTRYGDSPIIINDETKQITLIKQDTQSEQVVYKIFELNSNGTAHVAFPTNKSDGVFGLKIEYMDETTQVRYFYPKHSDRRPGQDIEINFLTKQLRLNKNITLEVVLKDPVEMLHYLVISHGRIRVADTVRVPQRKYQVITFMATADLVPSAHFIAYYFKGDRISAKRADIKFQDLSNNFIKMKLSAEQLRAGENVTIDVQTNPNAYVGLLAIDQSVLLLKSGNDLMRTDIVNELNDYHDKVRGYSSNEEDFLFSGIFVLSRRTDGRYSSSHYADSIQQSQSAPSASFFEPIHLAGGATHVVAPMEPVRIRKNFPETWLWEEIDDDHFNGTAQFIKTVPDTITSWTLSAFSIDPVYGLTLIELPRTLEVSQPFFIAMNLPYSVIRGEIVSVAIIVYNYLDRDVDAEIEFTNENDELEFIDDDDSNQLQRTKQTRIQSNDAFAHSFIIKPKKVGAISLKAKATSTLAGDGVTQILMVQPEGVPHYGDEAILIDLREEQQFEARRLEVDIPDDAVPDSARIEIKCMGDIFGGTIRNLPNLIRLPFGCGEQNMLNLVSNIVVLRYLNATGQLDPETELTAKEYTERGYQQQLAFKHDDGSFSAFGKEDKNGSTWLTAFVAKSLQEAAEYVDIDENVISNAFKWLTNVQLEDGSFPEVGRVLHKDMQGGSSRGVALTAYTLIAFLKLPGNTFYSRTIERATNNIVSNIDSIDDDIYALSLAAYALQLANHPTKAETMDKLLNLAENKGEQEFWSKSKDFETRKRIASKTINVEITAYGLLALVEANRLADGLPVLKWLLNQRNENGGFEGTQDTVLGLTALAAFARTISVTNKDIWVTVIPGDDSVENIEINLNDENALVLQTFEIPPSTRSIEVRSRGHGFGLLQLSYRYHLNDSDTESVFALKPRLTPDSNPGKLALEVCVSYNPRDIAETESNMVVLEVSVPSGFSVDTDSTYALAKMDYVKRVETKNGDTVFVLYFDNLRANEPVCPVFEAYRRHKIAEQKPVPVLIYDYYDSSQSAREFYTVPATTSCDICEGDDCQQLCIKGDGKRSSA